MPNELTLRLLNDSREIAPGRWAWSVWVDGPSAELDRVEEVRYTLHPTFVNPVRVVTDRSSGFKLESSGWGEFSILARLTLQDGRVESLERWLRLSGGAEETGSTSRTRPRVFLSGSGIDRHFISAVSLELKNQDVDVVTADDLTATSSIAESVTSAVASSDVVGVVLSRGFANTAQHDVAIARAGQKIVVPIFLGVDSKPLSSLADLESIHVTEAQSNKVADLLASRAKDAFFL